MAKLIRNYLVHMCTSQYFVWHQTFFYGSMDPASSPMRYCLVPSNLCSWKSVKSGMFRTENSRMPSTRISWPVVGWLYEISIGQTIHGPGRILDSLPNWILFALQTSTIWISFLFSFFSLFMDTVNLCWMCCVSKSNGQSHLLTDK